MNLITREELLAAMHSGEPLVVLEALPEKFYRHGHLPGALLFPLAEARELAPRAAPDRSTRVVVYCASATCKNSHEAADVLTSMGYRAVQVYADGKADWQAAGLELER